MILTPLRAARAAVLRALPAALVFGGASATPAQTAVPFVVKDLHVAVQSTSSMSSDPGPITTVGGLGYFAAEDGVNGRELWVTDGTPAGTRLVRDIRPGAAGSEPGLFTVFLGRVYFTADDGTSGRELWTTDGTPAGTRMVRDFLPGPLGSAPAAFRQFGGTLYFTASGPATPRAFLYTFDGTAITAAEIWGSCCERTGACTLTDSITCAGRDGVWGGFGVACGTVACVQPVPVSCCMPDRSCVYVDSAGCAAIGGTPGTPNTACGTCPGSPPLACCLSGGACVVTATATLCTQQGGTFRQLGGSCTPSRCAGPARACCLPSGQCFIVGLDADCTTPGGTLRTGQTCAGVTCQEPSLACCDSDAPCAVIPVSACRGNRGIMLPPGVTCAVTSCPTPSGLDLEAGQRGVIDMAGRPMFFARGRVPVNDSLWLWRTDATAAGTRPVVLIPTDPQAQGNAIPVYRMADGRVLFSAAEPAAGAQPATGYEPWVTDGTPAGTRRIKDVRPGPQGSLVGMPASEPAFVEAGGRVFFRAFDANGWAQVWVTDTTEAGTFAVTQLDATVGDGGPADLTPIPGALLFTAEYTDPAQHRQVRCWWRIELATLAVSRVPLPAGFAGITSPIPSVAVRDGVVYYGNVQLYATDGTTGGTRRVYPPAAGPTPGPEQYFYPTNFTAFQGGLLFDALAVIGGEPAGKELWFTDGTSAGTRLVKDIGAGRTTSGYGQMVAGDQSLDELFFSGPWPGAGGELLATRGVPGSTRLVKDVNAGPASSAPSKMVYSAGSLLFAATTPGFTQHLWRSDGTEAGTVQVGEPDAAGSGGSTARRFTPFNGRAYYFDRSPGAGSSLWSTDGTPGGAALAFDVRPGSLEAFDTFSEMVAWNGALYFTSFDGLHRSDGTPQGTTLVQPTTQTWSAAQQRRLTPTPQGLFFVDSVRGGLYVTHGTPAGTRRLAPGGLELGASNLVHTGGALYFHGSVYQGPTGVWRSDGTDAGTVPVAVDPAAGPTSPSAFVAFDGAVYFVSSLPYPRLWRTDGTPSGASPAPFTPAGKASHTPLVVGGRLVFVVDEPGQPNCRLFSWAPADAAATELVTFQGGISPDLVSAGQYAYFRRTQAGAVKLWRTDGTPAGTAPIALPLVGAMFAHPLGDDLLLVYQRADVGRELARTRAPADGVELVADINPGVADSTPRGFGTVGAEAFFLADSLDFGPQVFVTDGTPAGTRRVSGVNAALPPFAPADIAAAGPLFVVSRGQDSVYAGDGTTQGTRLVARATLSVDGNTAGQLRGVPYGARYAFPAARTDCGGEVFVTDGTLAGTGLLVDAAAGAESGAGSPLARFGARFLFPIARTVGGVYTDVVPGINDGTAAGSGLLCQPASPARPLRPTMFTDLGGVAVFRAESPAGAELWATDGTAGGTVLLKDINPGSADSDPREIVRLGGLAYFSAEDGVHGREPWVTDGTPAGTRMVRDVCPGAVGSAPASLTPAGDRLYFTAYGPETGVELWSSDGTAPGTLMMFEVAPGPSSASITNLVVSGSRLYFLAAVPPQGPALWSYDWPSGLLRYACPADYDRSASVELIDIFAFLTDWFAGTARADIDGDGATALLDIFAFLSAWFAGC